MSFTIHRLTGIQDAVYLTYAIDCTERNAAACLRWSIRRHHGALPDVRSDVDLIRTRQLQVLFLGARRRMSARALERIRNARPTRKLMGVML